MSPSEAMAEAERRIAEEAERRTGSLDLRDLGLPALPESLFALHHLRVLNFSKSVPSNSSILRNCLNESRSKIGQLKALEKLSLAGTDIDAIDFVSGLKNLTHFDCGWTDVGDLLPLSDIRTLKYLRCCVTNVVDLTPLSGLKKLQFLHCGGTEVEDLTPLSRLLDIYYLECGGSLVDDLLAILHLRNMTYLGIWDTYVDDLTVLAGLKKIQRIEFGSTAVSDISALSALNDLRYLEFSYTNVSDLSPLSSCKRINYLDCNNTEVCDLSALTKLGRIRYFECGGTKVCNISSLAEMNYLQYLGIWKTNVMDLSALSRLKRLQRFECSDTPVADLSPLARLNALREISCSNTLVNDLSPLSGIDSLEAIDCSGCRLSSLPRSIRDKPSLLRLHANNCHVPGLPFGILSRDCLDKVRAHYADLADGGEDFTDVKLLLLGNGGAGKTQIARWLAGEPFDPDWDSTHGIRIVGKSEPDSIAARLHLQMWDFGGQDIYHGTHALFLRGPALLMPAWATHRENRDTYEHEGLTFRNHPLAYWLDVARHQASPNNPVLVVQTHSDRKEDERRSHVPTETLDAFAYGTALYVSPKEGRGRAALEEALEDAIGWMRAPERLGGVPTIGAGRLRVLRRLEAMREADSALPVAQRRHRLLEQHDYEAICAEEGDVSSPSLLLDFLNATGTVFHRPALFGDRIVLDQGWALEAIYAVFDRKRVYKVLRQDGGRFTRGKLGLLVWRDHDDNEQELLLSMMQSCGMCFTHRRFARVNNEDAEYIAPDLLPERGSVTDRLRTRWDEDRLAETAEFRHALLHGGLIRSVMSAIGEIAGADALYWRGGLCAYESETRSRFLIEEVMTGAWEGVIRVRTQDGDARALLQRLVEIVERVQERLGMRPVSVDRPAPEAARPGEAPLSIAQEKPREPEWYVSYAWGDDTPEGQARAEIVDRLCNATARKGRVILRDKNVMSLGDSISAFMRRIGTGDRVFVILSKKYLESSFCMFELSEVWVKSGQDRDTFLKRVRVYTLPDARIWKQTERSDWAIHWKKQHDALESRARKHGYAVLGLDGGVELIRMQRFYTQVSDILGALADIVQPKTFEQLEEYGFDDPPA